MKTTIKYTLIIFLFFSFIIGLSCGKQKSKWKGTIEEVNGVIVVKNPKESIYSEDVFGLEEDLVLGETEGREEYMFSRIIMDVDEEERMYILDGRTASIRVFNKNGQYMQTIGRKGQGPGEMQRPRSIQITPRDEIMIYDLGNRRFSFFSLHGEFIKHQTAATARAVLNHKMDSKGYIVGGILQREGYSLNKFNLKLEPVLSIHTINLIERAESPELEVMASSFYFDLTKKDNIIWGFNNKYELQIFDSDGKLLRKIIKEYDPIEISEKEKEEYINRTTGGRGFPPSIKVKFPKYHHPFISISIDEEDRIFVGTPEKVKDKESFVYFDVFDSEGKYITKVPIELKDYRYPLLWKKKKLYIIDETEEGYKIIKRYEVKWEI